MTQYINKADLVEEIEKRKKEAESNCGGYKSYDEHRCDSCIVGFYEEFLETINTIEVNTTDAFIDKAWEWVEDNVLSINQQDKSRLYFEQFLNYMKGE